MEARILSHQTAGLNMAQNTPNQGPPQGKSVIVRGRIIKIEAEKFKDAPIAGVELGIEFDSVKENGIQLEIWFTYSAYYRHDVGIIRMSGLLMYELNEKAVKQIVERFSKDRTFEPWLTESILNSINFKCGTEAVFPAKVIELTSPIVPPRINLQNAPANQSQPEQQPPAEDDKPINAQPLMKKPAESEPKKPVQPAFNPPPAPDLRKELEGNADADVQPKKQAGSSFMYTHFQQPPLKQ